MSNEEEKHNHSNGFMNGLVLGAILGAGAVFLLGTKTGKKLLKAVSEEGMEAMSDLKGVLENEMDEEDQEEEMMSSPMPHIHEHRVPSTQPEFSHDDNGFNNVEHTHNHNNGFDYEEHHVIPVKHIKRFFRGTPKKN